MEKKMPNLIRKYSYTATYCTVWTGSFFATISPSFRGFAAQTSGLAYAMKGLK